MIWLRGTARIGLKITLKKHRLATFRTQDFRANIWNSCLVERFLGLIRVGRFGEALLQQHQPGTDRCSKETVVAHLHEPMRKHMLEKAVHKTLHGERAQFELSGI